jgi:hypothetical protein
MALPPPTWVEMGAFYPVLGWCELSAELPYTTQRTDIHIDAIVKGRDGKAYDAITVIIEVKGCWNKELQHAMQTQLVERYLKENHCQHGLYLVGWFLCDRWDESDYKKADTPKLNMDEMQKQLDAQAVELTQQNRRVKALVIDTSLHHA